MVRDAVKQFDDTATVGQIDALNKMTALYVKFQQDLSWLGGNFNQAMKRANELAIGQELTPQFFEQVLYPQVTEIQKLINSIFQKQPIPSTFLPRLLGHINEKLYLCISESSLRQSSDAPTARRVLRKRNSKLYFCADKLRSPPKSHLPTSVKLGMMSPRNSVTL
jgi:hypothetical protein